MSDKLLHERLRDADDICYRVLDAVGLNCDDIESCNDCYRMFANAVADEIERQYVPVPRFPDGEPVREGSETFYGTVSVVIVEMSEDTWGNWVIRLKDGNCIEGTFSKRVDRPEPDSLEKLRDDMREAMTSSPDAMFMDSRWVDRLTALMERGAR